MVKKEYVKEKKFKEENKILKNRNPFLKMIYFIVLRI